jgi:hypothetical protein
MGDSRIGLRVALVLLVPALAVGQSMDDAAQKEKERRKKLQQAGVSAKVITDAELKANHGSVANDPKAPPATTSPQPSAAKPPAAPTPAPTPNPREQEESWRHRVVEAQGRLGEAKEHYDFLNSLSLGPGESYVDENGKPLITSLEQLRRLIAEAKANVDAAQKALDDLLETAREQGVPPGWLR